jgi:hypothetical protein
MKMLMILLITLSCQTFGTAKNVSYETEEFRKYAELFEKYSRDIEPDSPTEITELTIRFAKLSSPRVGLCSLWVGLPPLIEIDRAYWAKASDTEKEVVMLHELGHCVLKRDHISTVNADGEPVSIMYPNNSVARVYLEAKRYYLFELFSIKNDWSYFSSPTY